MKRAILIADDEEAIRQSISIILKEEGYDCVEVSDGLSAIDSACAQNLDMVILDLFMPRKSGIEALAEIRRCRPQLPVLMLSSYYDVETAEETIRKGAVQYLLKPIDFDELLAAIHGILDDLT